MSFCTIGDASTSEGVFWETINAASVTKVPLAVFVWDDGYGISVPKEYQTTKGSISEVLDGFSFDTALGGMKIHKVKGWDYQAMVTLFTEKVEEIRESHIPALFHVDELTQPQGHSTSGSHERYKSKVRLAWEKEYDCNLVMEEWIVDNNIATAQEVEDLKQKAADFVKEKRNIAWENYQAPVIEERQKVEALLAQINVEHPGVQKLVKEFSALREPLLYEVTKGIRKILFYLNPYDLPVKQQLQDWLSNVYQYTTDRYHDYLYSHSDKSAIKIPIVHPIVTEDSTKTTGFNVLNKFFDICLELSLKHI